MTQFLGGHARILCLITLSACALEKGASDQGAGEPETEDTGQDSGQTEAFDDAALRAAIEADMAEFDVSATAVAVLRDGKTVWAEGFGTLTPDGSAAVNADTRFRVASVTKSMTAIAVLQQADAGCLALTDRISDHMPFEMAQAPGMAADMQIHHTLSNTAGINDYETIDEYDGDGFIEPFINYVQAELPLLAPPGRLYNYSNTNFVLAGRLVELCAGDYYRPYMDASVFEPLGLGRTTFDTDTVATDANYAAGVSRVWAGAEGTDTVLDAESYSASHLWPGMGAWSSVSDVARLAEFWMAGDPAVLPDALHAEMTSKQVERETGFADAGYGYGLDIKTGIDIGGEHYPVRMVSHGGLLFGYSAHAYTVPDLGVGVVVLLNREFIFPARTIEAGLALGEFVEPVASTTPPPDPSTFSELAGTYTHDVVMGDFIFSVVDGNLTVEIPSLDSEGVSYVPRLTAVRLDNFELQLETGVQLLSFIRDDDGDPEYVRNRYYVGKRVDRAVAPHMAPVPEAWGAPVMSLPTL